MLAHTYQKSGFNAFFIAGRGEASLLVVIVYVWYGLGHLTLNHEDTTKDYLPFMAVKKKLVTFPSRVFKNSK